MSVLRVTLAVLTLFICAFFTLRFYGLNQSYQVYDHPIMKRPTPWILAWGGDCSVGPSHSRKALQAAAQMNEVFLAVGVHLSKDKHFYILPDRQNLIINEMKDEDIARIDLGEGEAPLSLDQFFVEFSNRPTLLWVKDNLENIDLRLEPILKKHPNPHQILIHSEYDNVVSSIKKLKSDLIYGTGVGQRIRALMLGSLFLESIATIDGDFVLAPLKERGVTPISKELINEIARRKKIVVLGPLLDKEQNEKAIKLGATGYLTCHPSDLRSKFKTEDSSNVK